MSKIRIAVVNSHPIQYFAPMYAYVNASEDLNVSVLYCSDFSLRGGDDPGFKRAVKWDVDLLSGYNAVFLGDRARVRVPGGFFSLIVPEIWREVRSGKYDALIVHGHGYAANLLALVAAKTKGMPVMMRADTHLGLRCRATKRVLRRLLMGALYRWCDRFLAIGSANFQFYRAMGVPTEKIFLVPFSVDNDRFVQASALDGGERAVVRSRLGVPAEGLVVLYASKFLPLKHPDDVIRASLALKRKGIEFSLVMAGSGEIEGELRELAARLELGNVVFPGFINQSELPRVYAACDLFVFPAENEAWGLVVNEAMCAGLPVVVSDEVGCVPDLVREGENGFRHKAGNVAELASAMERILTDPGLRAQMGKASLHGISKWGYAQCLEGLRSAVSGLAPA